MSFGWSAGDIASAIAILIKVGKALKDSDGAAAEYQDTVKFLKSISKTLDGVQVLLEENPDLKWDEGICEQAMNLKVAIEKFQKKIKKYDLSLGADSSRSKARKVVRQIQFGLSADVDELRVDVTQAQQIMDGFISFQSLTSILDVLKTTTTSDKNLKSMFEILSKFLPTLQTSIECFQSDLAELRTQGGTTQKMIQKDIRSEMTHLRRRIFKIEALQGAALSQGSSAQMARKTLRKDFRESMHSLRQINKLQLSLLIELARGTKSTIGVETPRAGQAISVFREIGGGLASFVGAGLAISLQRQLLPSQASFVGSLEESILPSDQDGILITAGAKHSPSLLADDQWETAFMEAEKATEEVGHFDSASAGNREYVKNPEGLHISREVESATSGEEPAKHGAGFLDRVGRAFQIFVPPSLLAFSQIH